MSGVPAAGTQATGTHATGVRVDAPAKLNLVLHILAREASGFHGLESLFVKLALHDVVTIRTDVPDRSLTCDGPAMPGGGLGAPEANLAWRAAEAFAEAAGWPTGFAIAIEKHIPVGGGLGGGSADAAAVLRGLNAIAPAPLPAPQLLAIAGTLGSDVPFLASDAVLAWTWGRGDRLLALPPLPARPVLLAAFEVGVNTGAAYGALAASRRADATRPYAPPAFAYPADAFATWAAVARHAANDFEAVVPDLHAGVAAVLPEFRRIAAVLGTPEDPAIARLSGSGATCFLLAAGAEVADRLRGLAGIDGLEGVPGLRWLGTTTATAIVAPRPIP